ncbi:MAG: hypothetical protein AAB421_04975 [Patescibacteria group bacterium]
MCASICKGKLGKNLLAVAFSVTFYFLFIPAITSAQSDGQGGSAPPQSEVPASEVRPAPTDESVGEMVTESWAPMPVEAPVPADVEMGVKPTVTPSLKPVVAKPISPTVMPESNTPENAIVLASTSPEVVSTEDDVKSLSILWALLALLVALPVGYFAVRIICKSNETVDTEDDSHCGDLKKLLDAKLNELTDLRGQIEGRMQDTVRAEVRDRLRGTVMGDTLALIEVAEKEYGRLKKLHEECMLDFDKSAPYKGTIVQESLHDTQILESLKKEKVYQADGWTLHNVAVRERQFPELGRHLKYGPWYMHFWQDGNDAMKVIFKDKIFTIKSSDKETWSDAVAYGKSIGIPDEQLDFKRGDAK